MSKYSFLLSGLLLVSAAPWQGASAYTYKVIYSFCSAADCTDGSDPESALVTDAAGHLYGTTADGGKYGNGSVFELIPNADRTHWQRKTVHSFCAASPNCPDGEVPIGALIIDTNGGLYGTTPYRGRGNDAGTVYRLTRNDSGHGWKFDTLHSFCRKDGCPDGWAPRSALTYAGANAGLPYDGVSPLFGTTDFGGKFTPNDSGTVFRLTRDQATDTWDEDVLYSFCSSPDCQNPMPSPLTALTMGADGAFYGTTDDDGFPGNIFAVAPHGDRWKGGPRYTFCALAHCADGTSPQPESLAIDGSGILYGTTRLGGAHKKGTIFSFDPATAHLTTLYDFCALAHCRDGSVPEASLMLGASGDLFGTATSGGLPDGFDGGGTVFLLHDGALQLLHQFCSETDCADGRNPEAGLIKDSTGVLYGTTASGGAHGHGTVFALTP